MSDLLIPKVWNPEVQQRIFRRLLEAISYPGAPQQLQDLIGPEPTCIAVVAALCDESVTISDPNQQISNLDRSFLTTPEVEPQVADFVVCDANREPTFEPKVGDIYRPDESATMLINLHDKWEGEDRWTLTGPGIDGFTTFECAPAVSTWLHWRNERILYPTGVDLFICTQSAVIAIPRTTVARRVS